MQLETRPQKFNCPRLSFGVKMTIGFTVSCLALAFVIMGAIVMTEDSNNRLYDLSICTGNATRLRTDSAGICRRASMDIVTTTGLPVALNFPAINWLLACETQDSVESWIESIEDLHGAPFECYTAPPQYSWNRSLTPHVSDGITEQYDHGKVIGWIVMMSLGATWFAVLLCTCCCIACVGCCGGECRCFSWSVVESKTRF